MRSPARSRGGFGRLRVRGQLALVLLLPLLAVFVLAGVAVYTAVGRTAAADQALRLTFLAQRAGGLVAAVQAERAAAAMVLREPSRDASAGLDRAALATDEAASQLREVGIPAGSGEATIVAGRVDAALASLTVLRMQIRSEDPVSLQGVMLRYRLLVSDLVLLRQAPALAGLTPEATDRARAAWALSAAVEQAALAQINVAAATGQVWTPAQQNRYVAAQAGLAEALSEFNATAGVGWRAWWEQTVAGQAALAVQGLEGRVTRAELGEPLALDTGVWLSATGARLALMWQVVARVDVEVVAAAQGLRDQQVRTVAVNSAGMLAAVAAALLMGGAVARSLSRRLLQLRDSATQVANHHLPRAVSRLKDGPGSFRSPEDVVAATSLPMRVGGGDEVADVGRAVRDVSHEALRLAAAEAFARGQALLMFIDVARRMQKLAGALQARVDELERHEQDPDRLGKIFKVDQVGTRIARYVHGLLVLAGSSAARAQDQPLAVADLVVAASSQIEQYTRVETDQIDPGMAIRPHVIDDLVLLLAELLDNATTFSPPDSPVIVRAWRAADRVQLTVEDHGLGIAPDRLAQLNDLLTTPPAAGTVSPGAVGLPTVSLLAARYGIVVELSSRPGGGTVAAIRLPGDLIAVSARHARYEPDPVAVAARAERRAAVPVVPRPMDRRPMPALHADHWNAPTPVEPTPVAVLEWPPLPPQPDPGWQTARAVAAAPHTGTATRNGLPVRVPQTNLVPGAIPAQPTAVRRELDPNAALAAMRSYQMGMQRGARLNHPRSDLRNF